MLVSVVVPTYNAGEYLDRCVDSLLAQTLPADELEIILVDDGSTDDMPSRLDELARVHPNVMVVHAEHSGWPGRPRNIGVARARGEYIQFVDQDDAMAPDALRLMVELGRRNRADIVIGKAATDFRGVALDVFREDRDVCTIHDSPIINSLTPHKMFRRQFLAEHAIAFPEGKRRLEDQVFVVTAYFAAKTISILAHETCYFYLGRSDRGNAGSVRMVPASYYANVREVLDIVMANTVPGEQRARILRRFCRVELLGRLRSRYYVRWDPSYRAEVYGEVRAVLLEYMDPLVDAGLDTMGRLRASLVRADRPEELLELTRRLVELRARTTVVSARWAGGRLRIEFMAEVVDAGGAALRLVERDGRTLLDLGAGVGRAGQSALGLIDVTEDLADLRIRITLRDRETSVEWPVASKVVLERRGGGVGDGAGADGGPRPAGDGDGAADPIGWFVRCVAQVDPALGALDRPLATGDWVFLARFSGFGLDLRGQLGDSMASADREAVVGALPPLFQPPTRLVTLRSAEDGLHLEIASVGGVPAGALIDRPRSRSGMRRLVGTISSTARRLYRRLPGSLQRRVADAVRRWR